MPWFCNGCGERRGGTICKKWCREKYGDAGAERVPVLDGVVFINDDGSGIPRYELMRRREAVDRYEPRSVQGPRPNGWDEALKQIAKRCSAIIVERLLEC